MFDIRSAGRNHVCVTVFIRNFFLILQNIPTVIATMVVTAEFICGIGINIHIHTKYCCGGGGRGGGCVSGGGCRQSARLVAQSNPHAVFTQFLLVTKWRF